MSTRTKHKLVGLMAVAIISAFAFAGCGSNNNDAPAAAIKPTFLVTDTAGAVVVGATVYAIPAADVAIISAQTITLDATGMYTAEAGNVDEPLEDLINGNYTPAGGGVATYVTGTTDANGKVALASLSTDTTTYFIYVKPAVSDTGRLPGGSLCRTAVTGASLNNKVTAVEVSTVQTATATYIGSSACISCHPTKANVKQTMHKLGIMVPKSPSALQDVSKFQSATNDDENIYAGLNKFESGTTVYYYNYDSVKKTFKTLTTVPTGTLYFHLDLSKVGADYRVVFTNDITSEPTMTFNVALAYGGGLHKQRYMTKIGNSTYVLPLQFNPQGSDSSLDSGRTQYVEYNTVTGGWWIASSSTFTTPDVSMKYKSFDASCAGCHYTGYSVAQNPSGEWIATAVADSDGEVNPVAGTKMEMNIGCEVCHGPGSEHQAAGGLGHSIVTPQNLTPEREVVLCAACHTRGSGSWKPDTHGIEALLDSAAKQIKPGTSRAAFLAANTTQNDALSGDRWADGKHSKKHHQQATDYLQTSMYRNDSRLVTCSDCHHVHRPGTDKHQLDGTTDANNTLCTSCHTDKVNVAAHVQTKTGSGAMSGTTTQCIQCHATKTAKSGSGNPTPGVTGASTTRYYQNDITSHLFDVPQIGSISSTNAMPIPYTTNDCTGCHTYTGL